MKKNPIAISVTTMTNENNTAPVVFRIPQANPDKKSDEELVLKWCKACGEGYVNFCRKKIHDGKCHMQNKPNKE